MSTNNPMLKAALSYAAQGFKVFPLKPGGKIPITTHGFMDATTDEAIIRAWWAKEPNANIGIRCNGLLVGDYDQNEGIESLNLMQSEHGPLPKTWIVKTGGGTDNEPKEPGLQYIFKTPEGLNIRPGAGVDGGLP